jgi:Universal stress protein family
VIRHTVCYSVYRINEELEGRAKKILIHYGRRAVEAGCKHVTRILGKAHHPKALICEASEKRGIDYILIGRRGLSAFDRFVAGSVSKYVGDELCEATRQAWCLEELFLCVVSSSSFSAGKFVFFEGGGVLSFLFLPSFLLLLLNLRVAFVLQRCFFFALVLLSCSSVLTLCVYVCVFYFYFSCR